MKRDYLEKIISVIGTPNIKVIIGIRRSGKSCLLLQFMEHLTQTDCNANIIFVDYNSLDSEPYLEYHDLNNYIESQYDFKKIIMFVSMRCKCVRGSKKLLIVYTVV